MGRTQYWVDPYFFLLGKLPPKRKNPLDTGRRKIQKKSSAQYSLQNHWHLPSDTLLWRHNNKTFSLRNRKRFFINIHVNYQLHQHPPQLSFYINIHLNHHLSSKSMSIINFILHSIVHWTYPHHATCQHPFQFRP